MKLLALIIVLQIQSVLCTSFAYKPVSSGKSTWRLVASYSLLRKCLDENEPEEFSEMKMATSAYLALDGIKKQIFEENDKQIKIIQISAKGTKTVIAQGVYGENSFLVKNLCYDEFYELKVIERTQDYVILANRPYSIDIYLNEKKSLYTLSKVQIRNFLIIGCKLFKEKIEHCR